MRTFDLDAVRLDAAAADPLVRVTVLLEEGRVKLRRIELEAGGEIPPCRMSDDVVFVVLQGSVVLTCESHEEVVSAPGAAYVPADAATRSVRAAKPAVLLAVMCREGGSPASAGAAPSQASEGA
jgi:quercetin dioxygenase-like cupin family protein